MKNYIKIIAAATAFVSCQSSENEFKSPVPGAGTVTSAPAAVPFKYAAEQFSDLRVLRYQVKGFDSLSLKTKTLLYYLYEAALCGRDIIYDQNYKYNLAVRKTLEAIIKNYNGP